MTRLALILAAATLTLAAPAARADEPHPGGGHHCVWKADAVETLRGQVTLVERVTPDMPMMKKMGAKGVHLRLKTDKETIEVHLGPDFYVDKQAVTFAAGDTVEVKGSRTTHDDKPIILAGEVRKGKQAVRFRSDDGKPMWSPPRGGGAK